MARNPHYDISDPAQYKEWLAGIVAEIRTPEYIAHQKESGRQDYLKRMASARDRRLNPDPIDRSAHGRRVGNYEFITQRGD